MSRLLRLIILFMLLSLPPLNVNASDTANSPGTKPQFIPVTKKPCYVGCDYLFQFCYYYNILNMSDAISVKEWHVEGDFVTGKAVANINARLLIKMCYQVSLSSAYPVYDQDVNLESEFDFKIKLNGEGKDRCIQYQEGAITYSSFELKGDLKTDPMPIMQGQLEQDMADIIHDSFSKAVYGYMNGENKGLKVYCSEERNKAYEDNYPCRCD